MVAAGQYGDDTSGTHFFHWADYLVFAMFLVFSTGVGVFHGFRQRKGVDAKALLTGGGGLHYAPVALSMMASFLSAIFVLSIPAEIYFHGTTYSYLVISYFVGFGTAATVFMPVFHRLGVTSGYQYLEMRFNRAVRITGSLIFSSMMILYMSVVLYTPSLALAHVSGMQLWMSILVVGAVVTLYTSLGGMKATVWNDAFQMTIIFVGFTLMIVLGSLDGRVGGLTRAWYEAGRGQRLQFNTFNPDPSIRTTFWTQSIGGTAKNLTLYASSQAVIQKFLSCKTIRDGRKAVWLSCVTTTLLMAMVVLIACIMYTYYIGCDPLLSGQIRKMDQLIPLFIMDLFGEWHGLPGLLMAAVFSASLSTISGGVNALAAVFLEDIIKPVYIKFRPDGLSVKGGTVLTRCLAIFFGFVTIVLAFCAESMGKLVLQIVNSMFGCVGGPLTGVFILGMFFPFVNNYGALSGLVLSLILSVWVGVGGVIYKVPLPKLPSNIDYCWANYSLVENATYSSEEAWVNATLAINDIHADEKHDFLAIYGLSYMYYALFAVLICLGVGIPVSLITGGNKKAGEMDERLFVLCCEKNCLRPKSTGSPSKIYRPSMDKSNSMELNGKVAENDPMIKVEPNPDEKKKPGTPDKEETQPMIKPGNPRQEIRDPKAPLASTSEFAEV